MKKLLAACGNDCSVCPGYNVSTYEKTEDKLNHNAELWYRIGYRDRIVSNDEISTEPLVLYPLFIVKSVYI